jgi:putative heme transporter
MSIGQSERPGLPALGRRQLALVALAVTAVIGLLYFGLPAAAGLDRTWTRLSAGEPVWLIGALVLELASFGSYMIYFRAAFAAGPAPIDWPASYRITMAGVAATRVFAVAGAGGIALTAWALRRLGLARREVAAEMAAFYVLLYAIYMAALVIFGLGLYWGLLPGPAPSGLTLVPALFGALLIAGVLAIAALSVNLEGALARLAASGRTESWRKALVAIPATISSGVEGAIALLRTRRPGLLGALGWWGFDIAVLWACLEAFGASPPLAVIVMAYFVGMLANALPIPGGIGTVDGGMIGALIGFGVDGGTAIVAVLSYRAFAFWLPIVPGVVAYVQLLRAPGIGEDASASPVAGESDGLP